LAADSDARRVRLDRNESAYGPSEKAKAAFHEAIANVNCYPASDVDDLRAAVAGLHGVHRENITLGCGSTELLRTAAEVWLGPGKSLVTASPSYDAIARAAILTGAEVRAVPLNHYYAHNLEAMLDKIEVNTGLVYICNPDNPTGTLTPKFDLEAFFPKVPPNIPVLMDEAYHDYVVPTGAYTSWVARAASDPRLIVTRTFSNVYGLAGLRVGYAVSSKEIAARLSARQLPCSVNVVAARTAIAALSDQPYVKKVVLLNSNDRQEFYNQVNARMLRCLDSETNFVLLRTHSTGKDAADLLSANGVSVAAGYPHVEKYVRVTLGLPANMQAFWRVWDECMPHHPVDPM
jgi:histidinol-phosphate aminotransferase